MLPGELVFISLCGFLSFMFSIFSSAYPVTEAESATDCERLHS